MAVKVTGAVLKQLGAIYRGGTVAGLSDAELLERFACRSDEAVAEAAFSAIVTRHGPMVLGVCRDLVPDPADAEDAFQATFLVLARKAGSVRVDDSAGRWLYGVARKVATRARKRSAGRRDVTVETLPEVVSTAPSPIDVALSRERAELLRAEVARLPSRYREAVVLCHLEGRSVDEAAARLGRPVGTIKARLSRARSMLRARLSRIGLDAGMLPVVPGPLLHRTVRLAVQDAFRSTSIGTIAGTSAVSGTIINLAEGVLVMTGWAKVQAAGIAALSVGVTAVAVGGLDGHPASAVRPDEPQAAQAFSGVLLEDDPRSPSATERSRSSQVETTGAIEQLTREREALVLQANAEQVRKDLLETVLQYRDVPIEAIRQNLTDAENRLLGFSREIERLGVILRDLGYDEPIEGKLRLDSAPLIREGVTKSTHTGPRSSESPREVDQPGPRRIPDVDAPPDEHRARLNAAHQMWLEQYNHLWAELEPTLRAQFADDQDNPAQMARRAEARLSAVDRKRDLMQQKLRRVEQLEEEAVTQDPDSDRTVYREQRQKLHQEMLGLELEEIEAKAEMEEARRQAAAIDPRVWLERSIEEAFLAHEAVRQVRETLKGIQSQIDELRRGEHSTKTPDTVRPVRPPAGAPDPLMLHDEPVPPGSPLEGPDEELVWDPEKVEDRDDGLGLSRESEMAAAPEYVVEPPDMIRVEVLEALPGRPITGERLVRPDGRISLDFYGDIYVAGLTLSEVKEKVVLHLREFLNDDALGLVELDPWTLKPIMKRPRDSNRVFVDVTAYNSKIYYVQGGVISPGRFHITGNDNVLDAINFAGGLLPTADAEDIRLIRPAEPGSGGEAEVLMVDLEAIVEQGDTATNYQIKAGDRLVVARETEWIVEQEFLNHEEVQQLRDERARLEEKIVQTQRVVRNPDDPALRQLQADRQRVTERYQALWDEQAQKLRERLGVDPAGPDEDAGPPPMDGRAVDLYRFTGPRNSDGAGGSAIDPKLVEQLRALLDRLEATQERGEPTPEDGPSPSAREVAPPAAEPEVDPPSGFVPRSEEQAADQQPALRIDLMGPSGGDVLLGRVFDFQVTVRNEGDGEARDVDLLATISDGLRGDDVQGALDDARRFELAIGDLKPGEVRGPFPLSVRANGLGVQTCSMSAESPDLAPEAPEETREVTVVAPKLSLDVQGPDRRPVGSVAEYVLTLKNEGTAAATEVAVGLFAPESGSPDVPKEARYRQDPEKRIHTIYWRLPRLDKGESRRFRVPIRLDRIAIYTVEASAHSEGFREAKDTLREQFLTDVVGIADVKIVEVGRKDTVIGEGDTTEFEIRIRNDGSKEATNVKVDFFTNEWLAVEKTEPADASYNPENPVHHGFAPIDRLPPGAERTYTVTVKAAKAPPSGQVVASFDVKVFWDDIPESAAVSASSNLRIGEVEGR